MCIWNKILVGLIGVASIVLFYMAAKALKIETTWSESVQKHETKIRQLEKENRILAEGTTTEDLSKGIAAEVGVRQLRVDLFNVLLDRRRMWTNCSPKVKLGANGQTAEVAVTFAQPTHDIANKVILCAFEEAGVHDKANRGQYIGEFTVKDGGSNTGAAIAQLTLEPTGRLTPREAEKLGRTKGSWVLYEILPHDNHEIFAMLTDDQKKAMLPAESLKDYLRDGQPAAKDDPTDRVGGGKFIRQLTDYNVVFTDERDRRILLDDAIEATKRDSLLVEAALVEAREQEESVKRDIRTTETELAKLSRERDAVVKLNKDIQTGLDELAKNITRFAQKNREIVGQIAKYQLEAAKRIDERTRVMAQSATGVR
jgi:hypothetical protein